MITNIYEFYLENNESNKDKSNIQEVTKVESSIDIELDGPSLVLKDSEDDTKSDNIIILKSDKDELLESDQVKIELSESSSDTNKDADDLINQSTRIESQKDSSNISISDIIHNNLDNSVDINLFKSKSKITESTKVSTLSNESEDSVDISRIVEESKGLGKGLATIVSDLVAPVVEKTVVDIKNDLIKESSDAPRVVVVSDSEDSQSFTTTLNNHLSDLSSGINTVLSAATEELSNINNQIPEMSEGDNDNSANMDPTVKGITDPEKDSSDPLDLSSVIKSNEIVTSEYQSKLKEMISNQVNVEFNIDWEGKWNQSAEYHKELVQSIVNTVIDEVNINGKLASGLVNNVVDVMIDTVNAIPRGVTNIANTTITGTSSIIKDAIHSTGIVNTAMNSLKNEFVDTFTTQLAAYGTSYVRNLIHDNVWGPFIEGAADFKEWADEQMHYLPWMGGKRPPEVKPSSENEILHKIKVRSDKIDPPSPDVERYNKYDSYDIYGKKYDNEGEVEGPLVKPQDPNDDKIYSAHNRSLAKDKFDLLKIEVPEVNPTARADEYDKTYYPKQIEKDKEGIKESAKIPGLLHPPFKILKSHWNYLRNVRKNSMDKSIPFYRFVTTYDWLMKIKPHDNNGSSPPSFLELLSLTDEDYLPILNYSIAEASLESANYTFLSSSFSIPYGYRRPSRISITLPDLYVAKINERNTNPKSYVRQFKEEYMKWIKSPTESDKIYSLVNRDYRDCCYEITIYRFPYTSDVDTFSSDENTWFKFNSFSKTYLCIPDIAITESGNDSKQLVVENLNFNIIGEVVVK